MKQHFNIWGCNHVNKPGVQLPAAALVSMPILCSKSVGLSNTSWCPGSRKAAPLGRKDRRHACLWFCSKPGIPNSECRCWWHACHFLCWKGSTPSPGHGAALPVLPVINENQFDNFCSRHCIVSDSRKRQNSKDTKICLKNQFPIDQGTLYRWLVQ